MNIFLIISMVFIAFLLFGFLWGMFRSWKKSLIRFGILIVDVIIALFCAPLISKALIKAIAKGTTITLFSYSIDFSKMFEDLVGADLANDLVYAQNTTNELATSAINVLLNLVAFILMFIVLWLISLIIYAIIFAVVKHCAKKDGKEKKHENIGLRFIGGFVGFLSMCVIFFAFLIPVFGAMTICNNFIEENSKGNKASAILANTYIGGQLYYKDDEKIGTIETYIEKYSNVKEKYDKSIIGGFFNFTGLGKLGGLSFGYLTNVSSGELEINFTNEAVSLISTYNAYKETFIVNNFNVEDNKSVDRLINVYDKASKSEIARNYIVDLVPVALEKWEDNNTFLGISNPVPQEYAPIVNPLLDIFKVRNFNRIDSNSRVLLNMIKVANNNNLISTMKSDKSDDVLINYFSANKTFFKDTILELSKTEEFRNNLPVVFNELLKKLYDKMVGGENPIKDIPEEQIHEIDWNFEANNTQNTINELMEFYKDTKNSSGNDVINELGRIGKVIDYSRKSTMLSESFKSFITGYINSDKVDFGDKNAQIKPELIKHINEKWNYEEHPNFSFEVTFKAIAETYKIVNSITAGSQNVNLDNLSDVLGQIASNEESKNVVLQVVDSKLTDEVLGDSGSAVVVKDLVVEIIGNSKPDTIEKDIEASQKIVDIVNTSTNNEGKMELGQTEADSFVDTVSSSDSVMNVLTTASKDEQSELSTMINNIDQQSKDNIVSSINKNENMTPEKKDVLLKLFG